MSAPAYRCSSNACSQGNKACPTPLACEIPLDEDEPAIRIAVAIGWALLWFATIAVACGGAAWAGSELLEWMEPHWPVLVGMLS